MHGITKKVKVQQGSW